MKFKRAGMLTKILILALLIISVTAFLDLHSQAQELAQQQAALEKQVSRQKQENQALSDAIARSDDPESVQDVARDRLGLVTPGEIIFYDNGN